jgi:uncharacterized protein (DUF952 family)
MNKPTIQEFQNILISNGIIDPAAIEDPSGYDHCVMVQQVSDAYNELFNTKDQHHE